MGYRLLLVICMSCTAMLFINVKGSSQGVLNKKITLTAHELNIREVLKLIETQASVKFAYSSDDFRIQNHSVDVENEPLYGVLNELLARQQIAYRVQGNWVILYKNLIQTKSDSGHIYSTENPKQKR